MRRPESRSAPEADVPMRDGFEMRRWIDPPLDEYRALFRQVGGPWGWSGRLLMTDDELAAVLTDPGIEIWPLYDRAGPGGTGGSEVAGFIELDSRVPGEVEIVYFGLRPEYIGRGLGGGVLRWAIRNVWSRPGVDRFWLHTCDWDHPEALLVYQKAGFRIYDRQTGPEAYPAEHVAGRTERTTPATNDRTSRARTASDG